jgi:hypothetical protein
VKEWVWLGPNKGNRDKPADFGPGDQYANHPILFYWV